MSQFEMSILGIWGRISPKDIVESFDGDPNVELFMAEKGLSGTAVPKGRYTEFAEWCCFEFPGEFRRT